ncbi:MAG: VTT domain-containing protein [Bacteroidota bacterium]
MELLKHIINLDLHWIIQNFSGTFYFILFLIIFIETGVVIFPLLPGDSLLFTAGLFAKAGDLNIFYLVGLLFIAAVLGDNTNYFIGRNIGLRVLKHQFRGKPIIKQEYIDKTHSFFEKYGPKTIIMARFVPIVRTFSPFVAGVAVMKYSKFLSYDLLGGAVWIVSLTFAGYFLGEIDFIKNHIDLVAIAIIILSILPILIQIMKKKKQTH